MTPWQAVILGIVQGFTEFLPISSSGHLILFPELLGWPEQGLAFDVVVHLATLIAVLHIFRKDVKKILLSFIGRERDPLWRRLGYMLVAATVPVVLAGLFLGDAIDMIRSTQVVAWSLIGWGILLGIADQYQRRRSRRTKAVEQMSWGQALLGGCAQALALIPGTSRSGVTMTAGLASGLNRDTAARFSFLLSIPAIGAAAVYVVGSAVRDGVQVVTGVNALGFVAALISGYIAVHVLMFVIRRFSFLPFAFYRISVGIVLLLVL